MTTINLELWYGQAFIKDDSIGLNHIASQELLTTSAYLVSGAHNDGFPLITLKTLFRLSRVLLDF